LKAQPARAVFRASAAQNAPSRFSHDSPAYTYFGNFTCHSHWQNWNGGWLPGESALRTSTKILIVDNEKNKTWLIVQFAIFPPKYVGAEGLTIYDLLHYPVLILTADTW